MSFTIYGERQNTQPERDPKTLRNNRSASNINLNVLMCQNKGRNNSQTFGNHLQINRKNIIKNLQFDEPQDTKVKQAEVQRFEKELKVKDSCNQFTKYFETIYKNQSQEDLNRKQISENYYIEKNFQSYQEQENDFDPKNFLIRHPINLQMRAKMIDWMIEVLTSYQLADRTLFLAINIMDRFFFKTTTIQQPEELHLIGVTSAFIAGKYEELVPIQLQTFVEKIAHGKLTKKQVKDKEIDIMESLDHKISGATIYHYITLSIHKIRGDVQKDMDLLKNVTTYMSKLALFDYDLINNYNVRVLAGAILYVSLKLLEFLLPVKIMKILEQIRDLLEINNQDIISCSTDLLSVARNFDKLFPNMKNLQLFNQELLSQLQQKKNEHNQNQNQ